MNTRIGVGHSNKTNSKSAGAEAAAMALEKGAIDRADFALIFCGGKHNPHEFMDGVRTILGDTPNIGGSGLGIITNDFLSYSGYEGGVAAFACGAIRFDVFAQGGL